MKPRKVTECAWMTRFSDPLALDMRLMMAFYGDDGKDVDLMVRVTSLKPFEGEILAHDGVRCDVPDKDLVGKVVPLDELSIHALAL